jgi:hypothetical protein
MLCIMELVSIALFYLFQVCLVIEDMYESALFYFFGIFFSSMLFRGINSCLSMALFSTCCL